MLKHILVLSVLFIWGCKSPNVVSKTDDSPTPKKIIDESKFNHWFLQDPKTDTVFGISYNKLRTLKLIKSIFF